MPLARVKEIEARLVQQYKGEMGERKAIKISLQIEILLSSASRDMKAITL